MFSGISGSVLPYAHIVLECILQEASNEKVGHCSDVSYRASAKRANVISFFYISMRFPQNSIQMHYFSFQFKIAYNKFVDQNSNVIRHLLTFAALSAILVHDASLLSLQTSPVPGGPEEPRATGVSGPMRGEKMSV